MKKIVCIAVMALLGFGSLSAQENRFNLGVNLGLPTGDVSDFYSFALGVEANYLFEVSEKFQVGPSISYVNYFGKEISGFTAENASFLPLAGSGRFNASEEFVIGADIGYAIGISPEGNDGGFYYRPMLGYNISEKMQITASYSGVSVDGGTFSHFGVGIMFGL